MASLRFMFLVFLPLAFPHLLLQSSIFVTGDAALIQKTCQSNQYPDLCASTLKSDPTSINADTKGLAVIVIKVAKAKAIDTSSYVLNELLKNATTPLANRVLKQCSDKYTYASDALQWSLQDLDSDVTDNASLEVSAAADYPNACHNAFKGAPELTYPSGLAQREELLVHLCGVAVGIIDLLG